MSQDTPAQVNQDKLPRLDKWGQIRVIETVAKKMKFISLSMPKDLPRELKGLWLVQYMPLERAILKDISSLEGEKKEEALKMLEKYKNLSYVKRIAILDRQAALLGL